MTKIGFIGLGSQGAPMARRIIDAGYPVTLWARRPDSLAPFAGTAAETAPSIAELGERTERATSQGGERDPHDDHDVDPAHDPEGRPGHPSTRAYHRAP